MRSILAIGLCELLSFCHGIALAQDVIEVPPVEVEAARLKEQSTEDERTHQVEAQSSLEAPTGPWRDLTLRPAVNVREMGGIGQAATLQVRGTDPTSTRVTLEGVPLNSPFIGAADLSGLGLLPLESITLKKGGQSAYLGSGASAGHLAAHLPQPLTEQAPTFSLTLGSFGTQKMKLSVPARSGSVAGLFAAGILASAGNFTFIDRNKQARVRAHNSATALEALIKLQVQGPFKIAGLVEGFMDDREIPGFEQFPSSTARQRDSRLIITIKTEMPGIFSRDGSSDFQVYVRRLGFRFDDSKPPMGPPQHAGLVAWEASTEGMGKETFGIFALKWSVCGTHTRGFVSREGQKVTKPARSTAAFGAGASFEKDPLRADAMTRFEWSEGFGLEVLPAVEAQLRAFALLSVFASFSRSFRLPTFEELYFEAGFVQGNRALKPESAWTWDAGISLDLPKDRGKIKVAYFETRLSDVILFLPVSAYLIKAQNSGNALLYGLECEANFNLRPLRLALAYTWLKSRLNGRLTMPHRPEHSVGASLGLESRSVMAEVQIRSQSGFFLDRYESLREEGRILVDIRLEWTPVSTATIALEVQNLLDKRDAVDALQQPLPGRAFFGSLRVTL